MPDVPDLDLQQTGLYTITGLLRTGSTSSLYSGRQQQRRKDVLIKLLHTPLTTNEAKEAFLSRARQLKKLKHRNISEIQDFGIITEAGPYQDCGYFVMQIVPGTTLRQRFAPGQRLSPEEVKRILSPVADALHYAHITNVLHSNLHPGTLLIGERNETLLTDFSLPLPDVLPSSDKEIAAIPYRAPEHLRGIPAPASDQYALAVIAYELLCGQRPYEATEPETLLYQQEHSTFPIPSSLNPDISTAVEKVLLQALALAPEERFPHIRAFADAYLYALMGLTMKVETQRTPLSQSTPPNDNGNVGTQIIAPAPIAPTPVAPTSAASLPAASAPIVPISAAPVDGSGNTDLDTMQPPQAPMFVDASPGTPAPYNSTPRPNTIYRTSTPTFVSDARLQEIVSADLCQGGILSTSLPGYEERIAQIEMAQIVSRSLTEGTPAIVEAGTGTGKALDVDTPIPTPTGWKRMGDLVVGDFVFDEDGHPTRVMAAFDAMYDRTCYEVVFSDGSSIVADAEHEWASYTSVDRSWASRSRTSTYAAKNFVTSNQLAMLDRLIALSQNDDSLSVDEAVALIGGHHWSVYQAKRQIAPVNSGERPARYRRKALLTDVRSRLAKDLREQHRDGRAYTLVTTERMAATLTVGSHARANHAIPVAGPLALPDADLPIAPYFLGVWLGDGSSYNNQITSADPALATEIEKDGYTVRSLKSHRYLYAVDDENGKAVSRWQPGMKGRLRALGLLLNKHIPAIYLRASEQQRRALLAGLLDTDGTVSRCGAVELTTTNPQLAQDVYELACSLGFRPSLRCGRSRYNGKDCGPKWMLAFTTDQHVFRLERKVTAQKERLRNYSLERNHFRYVVAVREVPSRPVRCIQVESQNHLYLAGRSMIPTHNSLAYLLPIVRSGKVAIISTANKALQEQLFYKDIPFVQKHVKPFEAALVKGMGNYVCLDRLNEEHTSFQFYAKNREFTRLLQITEEDTAFSGDFETLEFPLPGDIRARVSADSDQCAWSKCNFYADCYVRKMRIRAEHAQIIVVNHTLLLLDAAMEGNLLPDHDVIVIDEAHHLEEEATRAFTITITPNQVATLLAQRMLKEHSSPELQDKVKQAQVDAWNRLRIEANPGPKNRVNLQTPFQEGLLLATALANLADSLRLQRPQDLPEKESQLYDKLLKRTQNLSENVRMVFAVNQPEKFIYYVERVSAPGQRGDQLQVSASPLDITSWLKESLFNQSTVICTSATLATVGPNSAKPEDKGPNFAYFRRRVGLDPIEYPDVLERILPLTFDYENNALLYLPRDLPEPAYGEGPQVNAYTKAIARQMYHLVKASRGRAFLLFSSKRMLENVYDLLVPHLKFPLLRQGDLPRIELTRKFREEGAVLFGLKSFWEGVDIPGEALSLVVIDKLPFDPPDDPVHEARVARMKAANENWFGTYVLPQAVLRLKQGLGRLLRTREDRGVMAILDTRLHTKGYGKLVLSGLPPARRTSSLKDVEQFFAEEEEPF